MELSKERVFYLTVLTRHASITSVDIIVIHMLLSFRWTKASFQSTQANSIIYIKDKKAF